MGYTKASLKLQLSLTQLYKIYELNLMNLQISQEWLACHLATFYDNWNCEPKMVRWSSDKLTILMIFVSSSNSIHKS